MNRYQIPKKNGSISTFLLWTWKDALLIIFVGVINYFLISKHFENTDNFFMSITLLPTIFALLIVVVPEINIKIIDILIKYFHYLFLLCKKYKFKEKG